ncbi:hypothetical protein [Myxococcus sp. AB036A]|uniref:hypothetical protein n=1 Tax=Myxococcus sp. AB036A TaxID=2562793 RepID=UPI001146ED34|nr:hypothetical protein [Myxococcus sp. AB036A]
MSRTSPHVPLAGALAALCIASPAAAYNYPSYEQLPEHQEVAYLPLDDGNYYGADPYVLPQIHAEVNYESTSNCVGICSSGMEYGDPDIIVFDYEGETPDAATPTEGPGGQVDPSTANTGGQPFSKTFHKSEGFGNNTFGAGYVIDVSLNGIPATSSAGAKLDAVAEGKIWAKAFSSNQREVVRARAAGSAQQNAFANAKVNVYVLGSQVYSKDLTSGTLVDEPLFNRTFFSASKTFTILFIPVTVTASLNGTAGIKVDGSVNTTVVKLIATPKGSIYASASAAVNVWVASIGVEGNLTLINVSLPTTGQLVSTSCSTLDWNLKSDFNLNTLSGNLKAFVKVKLLFIKKKASLTIAKWSGSTKNWTLVNTTSTVPLSFTCSNGTPVGGTGTLIAGTGGGSTGGGDTGGGGGGDWGGGGGGDWGGGTCGDTTSPVHPFEQPREYEQVPCML